MGLASSQVCRVIMTILKATLLTIPAHVIRTIPVHVTTMKSTAVVGVRSALFQGSLSQVDLSSSYNCAASLALYGQLNLIVNRYAVLMSILFLTSNFFVIYTCAFLNCSITWFQSISNSYFNSKLMLGGMVPLSYRWRDCPRIRHFTTGHLAPTHVCGADKQSLL